MMRRGTFKALLSVSIAAGIGATAMPAEAGTTGNGTAPVAKAHYSYCFGGLRKTVYFSSVIESAPAVNEPDLNGPYGDFLTKTFGTGSNDGGQCITSDAMADAVNGKKKREAEFVWETWKVVETNWAGGGAH
jgi:hypothetical protein